MTKRSYASERIINKLREVEILLSQGSTIGEAARKIGVSEQMCYPSGRQYSGIRIRYIKRLN